jgi:hypothetical protein
MDTLPAVGTYLMPVQAYQVRYCEQVLEAIDCTATHAPGMKALKLRRWGLDDHRQPFDDGHTGESWSTGTFRPVGHRAWRILDQPPGWGIGPIYFKTIPAPIVAGQLSLFS